MNVRALVDISSKNGIIVAGTTFDIPEQVFIKLAGKVEPLTGMTTEQPVTKIGAAIKELNRTGPWPGDLCQIITPEALARIQAANCLVDDAATRSEPDLDAALIEYRAVWLAALAGVKL